MEIKKIIKNNKGNAFPFVIAVVLCLMMLFVAVSQYLHVMIIAKGTKEALQDAVIATVNDNYANIYHAAREGYSAAYQPTDEGFEEIIDYGAIYNKLDSTLGTNNGQGNNNNDDDIGADAADTEDTEEDVNAQYNDFDDAIDYDDESDLSEEIDGEDAYLTEGNKTPHTKITQNGDIEFSYSNLKVDVKNAPLKSGDSESQRFKVSSSVDLDIPLTFCGSILPHIKITIKNTAGYTPKF